LRINKKYSTVSLTIATISAVGKNDSTTTEKLLEALGRKWKRKGRAQARATNGTGNRESKTRETAASLDKGEDLNSEKDERPVTAPLRIQNGEGKKRQILLSIVTPSQKR